MTDKEALEIILKADNTDAWFDAVYVAVKRLEDCQWHDYVENDYRLNFGMKVILGIRYDDGSRGSIDGYVMYDTEKGYYLMIDHNHRNSYTENAVIEKWMKYPKYN